jgi:uncharacterized damage-inducible protein DinB
MWVFQKLEEERSVLDMREYLRRWRHSCGRTMALVNAAPESVHEFRPAEGYRSIREQIAHLIASEKSILEGLETGEFRWKETEGAIASMSVAQMIEQRNAADVRLGELLANHEAGWLEEPVPGSDYRRGDWLREMYEHELHHRGILSLSLRLAGIEPPRIY